MWRKLNSPQYSLSSNNNSTLPGMDSQPDLLLSEGEWDPSDNEGDQVEIPVAPPAPVEEEEKPVVSIKAVKGSKYRAGDDEDFTLIGELVDTMRVSKRTSKKIKKSYFVSLTALG